jgi:ABC-type transport system substrate-binding protein
VIPNTATAMPEIADGGRTWTIRLRRGIRFADDPAFKGKPRELVAGDYVYAIKRRARPDAEAGGDPALTDLIAGARPVVDAAKAPGAKFDYDRRSRASPRPTRTRWSSARPRSTTRCSSDSPDCKRWRSRARRSRPRAPTCSREPVGTGPFVLKEWRKGSRVVLEANPNYRRIAFPASSNPEHRALVESMKGVALPAIGRIEISIIEEFVPEVLAFEKGELDIVSVGGERARPHGGGRQAQARARRARRAAL